MKKKLLSISFLIIALSVLFTLLNCGGDENTTVPCVSPKAPTVKAGIKIVAGQSILLTATDTNANATYKWTGPNNFSSIEKNPTITNATEAMAGDYKCTVTVKGCTSAAATTIVAIQGTIKDIRDDEVYKTIKIGTQTWMAENLKWQNTTYTANYKLYGNNPASLLVYGVLYDWFIAQKAAAGFPGWRLPTEGDWQKLVDYLGGYLVAGAKLKESGTAHWAMPNYGATNSSGFTAIGSGYHDVLNDLGPQDLNNRAYYWSSTPYETNIKIFILRTEDNWTRIEWVAVTPPKCNFLSIRLVKI